MQKINCPECGKQFIWTDDSPSRGKCPNEDCEWQYHVRKEIGTGLAKRTGGFPQQAVFSCPECGAPLYSGWTCCASCGTVILAFRPLRKRHIFFIGILVLVLLSLAYRYFK